MRFDHQWHGLDTKIFSHGLKTANLTPKPGDGEEETQYGQNAGAGGNEYRNFTSRHDWPSLDGPPHRFGGRLALGTDG
ncbi:MAG TPA: hypothetical protein VHY77_09170 [Acidimicrobiales bacterium]|nr:hypothetical protein [Acidimicrobiales bacterium]